MLTKAKQDLIGVIVPVYKVEKYIAECIESILAQTYTNFRLIIVDDGSPDNAGKICDEYAKKDSRITVIHQENAGVTRARARGVEVAKECVWITFVDGDDTLPETALQDLFKQANKDIDIVIGGYEEKDLQKLAEVSRKEYIYGLIDKTRCKFEAPWGRLFRKKLLTPGVFDIPRSFFIGEDTIMNVRIAFNSQQRIIELNKKTYNYNVRIESVSHSYVEDFNYLVEYFHELERSIPLESFKWFIPIVIKRKMWYWAREFRYSAKRPKGNAKRFVDELKNEIKAYNHRIDITDRVQLFCPLRIFRYIFVKIRIVKNILKSH